MILKIIRNTLTYPIIIQFLQKILGANIYTKLPFGLNPILDIKYIFPNYKLENYFDVGSNIGQTENKIFNFLTKEKIYCFEPIKDTYLQLLKNIKGKNTESFNIAFGENNTFLDLKINNSNKTSPANSLSSNNQNIKENYTIEKIEVRSLDSFMSEKNIGKISFLKIDAEGYEDKILSGAHENLKNSNIDFIELEVGLNPFNNHHIEFEKVKKILESYDYYLFGLYEQVHDFMLKKQILRRCNAVFISNKIA
ncbi:MAG: 2-O-methyltransferase NoeI [Bacteroidota bacterium]|jgi:FkbM family methyltransferase